MKRTLSVLLVLSMCLWLMGGMGLSALAGEDAPEPADAAAEPVEELPTEEAPGEDTVEPELDEDAGEPAENEDAGEAARDEDAGETAPDEDVEEPAGEEDAAPQDGETPPAPPSGEDGETPPAPPSGEDGKTPPAPPSGEDGKTPPAPPSGEDGETPPAPPSGEDGETPPAPPSGEDGETPLPTPGAVKVVPAEDASWAPAPESGKQQIRVWKLDTGGETVTGEDAAFQIPCPGDMDTGAPWRVYLQVGGAASPAGASLAGGAIAVSADSLQDGQLVALLYGVKEQSASGEPSAEINSLPIISETKVVGDLGSIQDLDTVEKIEQAMADKAVEENKDIKKENVIVLEIEKLVRADGDGNALDADGNVTTDKAQYVELTPEEIAKGCTFVIPYAELKGLPADVAKNYKNYDFVVLHMFSTDVLVDGKPYKAGEIVVLEAEATADGLKVTIQALSPFAVAWTEAGKDRPSGEPGRRPSGEPRRRPGGRASGEPGGSVYEVGELKIHALDASGEMAYIIETEEDLIGLSAPVTPDGQDAWSEYVEKLDKPLENMILTDSVDPEFVKDTAVWGPASVRELFEEPAESGEGQPAVDVEVLTAEAVTIAGVQFAVEESEDGFSIVLPEVDVLYVDVPVADADGRIELDDEADREASVKALEALKEGDGEYVLILVKSGEVLGDGKKPVSDEMIDDAVAAVKDAEITLPEDAGASGEPTGEPPAKPGA